MFRVIIPPKKTQEFQTSLKIYLFTHYLPIKKKHPSQKEISALFSIVGMTGFEHATPRPPDEYSNRAELHPEKLNCYKQSYKNK